MKKFLVLILTAMLLACTAVAFAEEAAPAVVSEAIARHDHGLSNYFLYQEYDDETIKVYQVSGGMVEQYASPPWLEVYTGYIIKDEDASGKMVAILTFETMLYDFSVSMTEEEIAAGGFDAMHLVEMDYLFDEAVVDVVDGAYTFTFVYDMAGSASNPVDFEVNAVEADAATDAAEWAAEMGAEILAAMAE